MRILSLLIISVWLYSINQKTNSPHGTGLKISCKTCHSSKGWQIDKETYSFDHNTAKLPLVGQHKLINCRQCHPTLIFTDAKTRCNECHTDLHQETVGPDCSRCHTPASWLVNNTNELHQMSRFPLVGAHRTADCIQCHKSESLGRYDVLGIFCINCHRENYIATTNPNHIQSGISEDCAICHKINSFQWTGATFDHSSFPLVLGHSAAKCIDCHETNNYKNAKPDCFSCHEQNYISSKNPDHVAARFSTSCQDCHTLNLGWKPSTYSHNTFPLELAHAAAACSECHTGGNYLSASPLCYSCHQQNYISTTNPNHATEGFPTECQTCHTIAAGWKPVVIDHSQFPLNLGHSTAACNDCHTGGNYTTTSRVCYSCHQANYTATTNPDHILAGFLTTCETCHTTNPGWNPAFFVHTGFPLTLGHSTPTCSDCHTGGNYSSNSTDCYSCHQANYTATTNPNHVTAGFPTTCATCHNTNPGWTPATFSHTIFPLTLGHSTPACADCHTGGNYTTTPTACYSCHMTDYNSTSNPNHTALGFSTTCTTCHTTNPGWIPATYAQHDAQMFPIYSGRHRGKWTQCTECHPNPANYTLFDCIRCHSGVHRDKNYTNAQCYDCHPRGDGQ